ncbi:hypothetical protein BH24CHL4_BH24CHL4_05480 [soil metagenome]
MSDRRLGLAISGLRTAIKKERPGHSPGRLHVHPKEPNVADLDADIRVRSRIAGLPCCTMRIRCSLTDTTGIATETAAIRARSCRLPVWHASAPEVPSAIIAAALIVIGARNTRRGGAICLTRCANPRCTITVGRRRAVAIGIVCRAGFALAFDACRVKSEVGAVSIRTATLAASQPYSGVAIEIIRRTLAYARGWVADLIGTARDWRARAESICADIPCCAGVPVVAWGAVGLIRVRADARPCIADAGIVTLVGRRANDRRTAYTDPTLAGVAYCAGIGGVAHRLCKLQPAAPGQAAPRSAGNANRPGVKTTGLKTQNPLKWVNDAFPFRKGERLG